MSLATQNLARGATSDVSYGLAWGEVFYRTTLSEICPISSVGGYSGFLAGRSSSAENYVGVLYSADGVSWAERYLPGALSTVTGLAQGGFTVVAVTANGKAYTTEDTLSWTERSTGGTASLSDITYAGHILKFIAVGSSGRLVTSTDGVSWTAQTSGTTSGLIGVAASTTRIVAVGAAGVVVHSTDGVNWTVTSAGTTAFTSVAWSDTQNLFVAVGYSGVAYSSPDGVTWTARTTGTTYDLAHVATGGGTWVAVALSVSSTGSVTIVTSTNGTTWTVRSTSNLPNTLALSGVAYRGGTYVAVGASGFVVSSSDNGATWVMRNNIPPTLSYGVTYDSSRGFFISVGAGYQQEIRTSPDGYTWTVRRAVQNASGLISVCASSAIIVAGGVSGVLFSSPDAVTWTARTSNVSNNILAIARSSSTFVGVGNNSVITTSTDGVTWTARTAPAIVSSFSLGGVAWASSIGLFAACSSNGQIITSPTGTTWTAQASQLSGLNVTGMAASATRFVVVGESIAATSTDGVTWTVIPGLTTTQTVTWTGRVFLCASELTVYILDENANLIGRQSLGNYAYIQGLAGNDSRIVCVGNNGRVAISPPPPAPYPVI